jgi:hypothetical protein
MSNGGHPGGIGGLYKEARRTSSMHTLDAVEEYALMHRDDPRRHLRPTRRSIVQDTL